MNSEVSPTQIHINLFARLGKIEGRAASAVAVCQALKEKGFEAFFVGGCVRDLLLYPTRMPTDIDITTSASTADMQALFPKTSFVGQSFGVCMVKQGDDTFEVATFRKDGSYSNRRHPDSVGKGTQYEDSLRRDFTINALYFDPIENTLVDFHNGQGDLQQRLLRCVGIAEQRLHEDALRIIRLFRFAARFDFLIDPATVKACQTEIDGLDLLSRERLIMEIEKVPSGKLDRFVSLIEQHIALNWLVKNWQNLSGNEFKGWTIAHHAHQQHPVSCFAMGLLAKKSFSWHAAVALKRVLETWPLSSADSAVLEYLLTSLKTLEGKQKSEVAAGVQLVLFLKRLKHVPVRMLADFSAALFSNQSEYFKVDFLRSEGAQLALTFLHKLTASTSASDADASFVFEQNKKTTKSFWSTEKILQTVQDMGLTKSTIAQWIAWQEFVAVLGNEKPANFPEEGSSAFFVSLT